MLWLARYLIFQYLSHYQIRYIDTGYNHVLDTLIFFSFSTVSNNSSGRRYLCMGHNFNSKFINIINTVDSCYNDVLTITEINQYIQTIDISSTIQYCLLKDWIINIYPNKQHFYYQLCKTESSYGSYLFIVEPPWRTFELNLPVKKEWR